MDGIFPNPQRLVQGHERAADPPLDPSGADHARSDLWFTYHLGKKLKEKYASSTLDRDRPIKALVWNYDDPAANRQWRIKDEPSAELVIKEINGYKGPDKNPLANSGEIKDAGTTACGAWIYTGIFAPAEGRRHGGINKAAQRNGDGWVALGWGFSWPANRRLMYNRSSAD